MPLTPNGKKADEMTRGKKSNLTSQRTELLKGKTPLLGVTRDLTRHRGGTGGHSAACESLRQAPCALHIQGCGRGAWPASDLASAAVFKGSWRKKLCSTSKPSLLESSSLIGESRGSCRLPTKVDSKESVAAWIRQPWHDLDMMAGWNKVWSSLRAEFLCRQNIASVRSWKTLPFHLWTPSSLRNCWAKDGPCSLSKNPSSSFASGADAGNLWFSDRG